MLHLNMMYYILYKKYTMHNNCIFINSNPKSGNLFYILEVCNLGVFYKYFSLFIGIHNLISCKKKSFFSHQ